MDIGQRNVFHSPYAPARASFSNYFFAEPLRSSAGMISFQSKASTRCGRFKAKDEQPSRHDGWRAAGSIVVKVYRGAASQGPSRRFNSALHPGHFSPTPGLRAEKHILCDDRSQPERHESSSLTRFGQQIPNSDQIEPRLRVDLE